MERKQVLRTQDKSAGLLANGYDMSTNLEQSNKPLPVGNVISIVDAGEQFVKEREESSIYRLTATLKPTIFYPQDFHWLGNPTGNLTDIDFTITSTSDTSPLDNNDYGLPNLLNPTTPSPTKEQFRLDKTDNWIGQILQPYENDYLKLYDIPEFTVNIDFVPDPNNARYGIDTGINSLIYIHISNYLDTNVYGSTFDTWFNGSTRVLGTPLDGNGDPIPGETLKISNQNFKGYTQDGVPFLFSTPVRLEKGWFTALYVPFEHNFEEGDYVFVKTVASEGGQTMTNSLDNTCDPSLYGFHRVISSSWDALGDKYSKHYVIVEHKSEYHDEWINNTQGVAYAFTVESSQGFIKRIRAYSNDSIKGLFIEPLLNTTFTPQGTSELLVNSTTVTAADLALEIGDQVLITISTEALGTFFPEEQRPISFNMSGIYTVTSSPMGTPDFTIRSQEFQDNIAYFNGNYNFGTLPGGYNYYIKVSKFINTTPSDYYLRKGKIITTINDFNINKLPFSESIYGDTYYSAIVEKDIDIDTLRDNHQRPITQLYLSVVKRSGQQPYDFTDVESFFSWTFTQKSLIRKTGDGLEIVSRRTTSSTSPGHTKDIEGGWMQDYLEYLGDSYYIDFSEYNMTTLEELQVETIKHRFNTIDRECENDNCNEYIMEEQTGNFASWNAYPGPCALTLSYPGSGIILETVDTQTQPCTSLAETSSTSGSFISNTFTITTDQVDEEMVLEFVFTQINSTGVVRIVKPNGSLLPLCGSVGCYPGNSGDLDGTAQSSTFAIPFTPDVVGNYTLLLGVMGYSGPPIGGWVTAGIYDVKYDNVKITRYFGTPQYGGWTYDPFAEYKIKVYSEFIETADPKVLGIPYYATFMSGLYLWRDILTFGFFEDLEQTKGVDYPFLNGKHYMDIDKHFLLGLTPYSIDETSLGTIIFGCQDPNSTNYLSYATVPCGSSIEQNGPCVNDLAGVMQTGPGGANPNLLGCCCSYEGSGTIFGAAEDMALVWKKESLNSVDPATSIRVGDLSNGWLVCRGFYPYWKDAYYWYDQLMTAAQSDFYSGFSGYNNICGLRGVNTGVDNPAFRVNNESGDIGYDIFRYENYVTAGVVDVAFMQQYGDLTPDPAAPTVPWYSNEKGRKAAASDLNDHFKVKAGNNTTNPNQWNGIKQQVNLWSTTESVTNPNGDNCTDIPHEMTTGHFYFYKFDTSNCLSCFDRGTNTNPYPDINAPRHGWPVDVNSAGDTNDWFKIDGNATQIYVPEWSVYNMGQGPQGKRVTNQASCGFGNNNVAYGEAGLIQNHFTGSFNTNIAAYRAESDPTNWRMEYANASTTWGCDPSSAYKYSPFSSLATFPLNDCVPQSGEASINKTEYYGNGCINQENPDGSHDEYTAKINRCILPTVGKAEQVANNYTSSWSNSGNATLNNEFPEATEQPTIFEPGIIDNSTHHYEFRGRVNIEMAINNDGYETFYNDIENYKGWALAAGDIGDYSHSPGIRYNNTLTGMLNNTDDSVMTALAATMAVPGAYKDYTRLYSGFWIGVVSHTDKVTYIYDADDGTAGGGVSPVPLNPQNQSDGKLNFTNVPWYHGCGGFNSAGDAVGTRMGYSPCRDGQGGAGTFSVSDCTTGTAASSPKNDISVIAGDYLPSCGEPGTNSSRVDFQKQWSQSFKSIPIPMKQGDQAFIYIKSVGGAFRAVNTFDPSGFSTGVAQGLPSFWAARQID